MTTLESRNRANIHKHVQSVINLISSQSFLSCCLLTCCFIVVFEKENTVFFTHNDL